MDNVRKDAQIIIEETIEKNLPNNSVINALETKDFNKNLHVIAIGKAAWSMAKAASDYLGDKIKSGLVVTKYDHSEGELPNIEIIEAGHPLADENSLLGAQKAIELAQSLTEQDELIFLISGGGSALFEKPLDGVSLEDVIDVTDQLLASGADIIEVNMIRKRLSSVKAGRFAQLCKPAELFTIVLSDVLGDRLDSIASGPAAPDMTTVEQAQNVIKKYNLKLTDRMKEHLLSETPKALDNVETVITGSVRILCDTTAAAAEKLGYKPYILSSTLNCEAREAGRLMATIAQEVGETENSLQKPCAIILGGETVVQLKGKGLGGRNQELAFAAAQGISGMENVVIFSLGSDGTDGPTDAAGGIVDGKTYQEIENKGFSFHDTLENNDTYPVLKEVDGLIMTGPTGTNVNDVSVILYR